MKKTLFSYRFNSVSGKIKNYDDLSILEIDDSIVNTTEILKSKNLRPVEESLSFRLENNALIISGEAKEISDFDFAFIPE